MSTYGERLREERERLGMNQTAFAAQGGVQKRAQVNYEASERYPDVAYLGALATVGVDVQYVVTGVRSGAALPPDEQELLDLFRAAPLAVKAAAIGALQGGSSSKSVKQEQVFKGKVGQAVKVKTLDQKGISFFGSNDKKK